MQTKRRTEALIRTSKSHYFHALVYKNEQNPTKLFQVVSKLLGSEKDSALPQQDEPAALALKFSEYFEEKVTHIGAASLSYASLRSHTRVLWRYTVGTKWDSIDDTGVVLQPALSVQLYVCLLQCLRMK